MKLKVNQIVCLYILLGLPFIAASQKVDEIIEKHIAAHGGVDKWNKVNSLKITGTFTAFSIEKDYMCYKTKSGSYYGDFSLGEFNVVESFDGKSGWTIDPWQEITYARNINSDEANVFMQKAEFFTPFFNYKSKGYSVEDIGKDTIDGIELFVLKLTKTNGKVETWYLNSKTYLEYCCKSDWVDFASAVPSEVFFDDFRNVDGLIIPFFSDRTFWQRDRILQIEKIEINPEIDPDIYIMPRRNEIKKLDFLIGKWNVKVEVWTRRGTWYELGSTTSDISFESTNLIQEKISYDRTFNISKVINYTFNESGNNYRISVFNDFSSEIDIYTGNFADSLFVFDDTKISFLDNANQNQENIQYNISNINNDGFVVEIKKSSDKGVTWNPGDRFTYTRMD